VRATYYLTHLPKPADDADAVAGVMGVIRNCQFPYGAPDNRFDTYPTWWASASTVDRSSPGRRLSEPSSNPP
jgi:penicillin V acylase-like amidase (Ntn superfamily)